MDNYFHETFYVAGTNHRGDNIIGFVEKLSTEDSEYLSSLKVRLEREPLNEYDKYAVKVFISGKFVGYVPRISSQGISTALARGANFECTLIDIGIYGDPQIDIVCRELLKSNGTKSTNTTESPSQNTIIAGVVLILIILFIAMQCA